MTWKVWAYPTSYILGFARSVTIEHLDPNLAAAVVQSGGVKYRPHTRYGRTLRYFGLVSFGATEPAAKAADVLVKVHSKAIGNDPVTGGTYDANKPSSQLWIHMTAWHSILYCYEKFGPGRLTRQLAIDRRLNGLAAEKATGLWIEDRGVTVPQSLVKTTARIGVDYAGEIWANKPWRFTFDPARLPQERAKKKTSARRSRK